MNNLSKPEMKVMAKALILGGYSTRKVEEILGIDNVTAHRYAQEQTPEDQKQFETIFKNHIKEQKQKGIALGVKRINELIPRERKISEVVRGLEFLEGINKGNTNIQVNVTPILSDPLYVPKDDGNH